MIELVPENTHSLRNIRISRVPHCSIQTRRRLRLRYVLLYGYLPVCAFSNCCLLAGLTIGTHELMYFGAITFIIRFRLECFVVYASFPLLPPYTQDSLRSGLANLLRWDFHLQGQYSFSQRTAHFIEKLKVCSHTVDVKPHQGTVF